MTVIECLPIGNVVGGRADVEDDAWGDVEAVIRIDGAASPPTRSPASSS